MAKVRGGTPDEYLSNVPPELQERVRSLHQVLEAALPEARVQIKWGQPAFIKETILISYAVFTHHINLYSTPSSREALSAAGKLEGFKVGKGSIQLPHAMPLPRELIELLAISRAAEYEEHQVLWMS
ncbi:iron chaperone [Arthrobacter sp. MYb227]|uniref:iron chaperone n=1 Tax=Arthrobacter sp. MYb227 TaxID=1848601 RepID=UPI001C6123DC|nr:DUF1801 domain-containing protein [Arthrobacter sp. MYb227]